MARTSSTPALTLTNSSVGGGSGYVSSGELLSESCDQEMDDSAYWEPVYTASLGGISDYLDARPSEFRDVVMDAVDALNETPDILEPGTIKLEITVNGNGVITGVDVQENTTGVDEIVEILEGILMGSTVSGASAGRTVVTVTV